MLNNGTFLLLAYRISKLDKYNWKIFSRPGYRLFTINASVGLDSDDRESNMNEIYQIQRILQSIIPITSRINGSLNIQNLKKIGMKLGYVFSYYWEPNSTRRLLYSIKIAEK